MTLPAFSQAGTGSTGNPSWPTHAAGHLGLLFIEFDGSNNPSTPSGWTIIPGFPVTQPTTKLAGYYRFATSSSESAPTISITAEDHHWAVIVTYTGVNTINPFHLVATTSSGSITQKTFPGFTTFLNDCMIVNVLAWGLDNAGPLFSGETNADLGSVTERYDAGTISASGGGLYVNDGTKAAKGEFGYTQATASSANVSNGATLALQSADQSFGTKSQIINNKRRTMEVLQSTAQDWRFAMFDSADGVTGKTGLTLAVTLQKQGDTSFSSISPTVTEIGNGHYNAALTTTHMNTLGCTSLRATATGAIPADCPNCIDVTLRNKQDAVRQGMTALPNVASGSAGAIPTTGTGANQIAVDGAGNAKADVNKWLAGTIPAVSVTGVPLVDAKYLLGTIFATPATAGLMDVNVKQISTDGTAADNLESQFDGTGLTGGTFPAPQSQITTLSSDAASGLASLQADTDDIQVKIGTPAGASVSADIATTNGRLTAARAGYLDNLSGGAVALASAVTTAQADLTTLVGRLTALRAGYLDNLSAGAVALQSTALTIAGYIDTEVASLISSLASAQTDITTLLSRLSATRAGYLDNLSAGAVALASALATAQTAITAIKVKSDQFVFTVANQVDANALTGGGGATAADVVDELEARVYEDGLGTPASPDRTYKGLFRRLSAMIENATGLKGSTVQLLAPDGTVLAIIPQTAQGASHSATDVSGSEA